MFYQVRKDTRGKFWEVAAVIQMFSSKQMKEFEKQVVNASECVETAWLTLAEDKKTYKFHRFLEKLGLADTVGCPSNTHPLPTP